MEAEEILYNFITTPVKWNDRNWKYKTAFALSLLALGGVAYASSDTAKKTYEKYFSKSSGKAVVGAPAVVVANDSAVKETLYIFTPDIEVIGSDSYKQKIHERLEELDTTPNFKIRNMTARQYVEKYLDYLYEAAPGTKEKCPSEAIGKKGVICLSEDMANAGNLLHEARHNDQSYGELSKEFDNKAGYYHELDAVDIQSKWLAAKNNWSEEQRQKWFDNTMKYYEAWKK